MSILGKGLLIWGKDYCLSILIYGIINLMEEKPLENNSLAVGDKYQEPIKEESIDSEEKDSLEKETSLDKEKSSESAEKSIEEKTEAVSEKKIEAEPTKEKSSAEVSQPAEERKTEEAKSTAVPPSAQAQKQVKQLKDLDRSSQVKELCDLAFQKGLAFAIEVAKTLDNAYVLDEFHDTLVSELYNELIKEDKLKQM